MKQEPDDTKAGPEDTRAANPPEPNEYDDTKLSANEFQPIKISGEPLSAIILRERR